MEVPEYWIIDSQENKITVLLLNEGLYEETIFTEDEKIISSIFTELEITAKEVFSIK